jgi:hypothetical protein
LTAILPIPIESVYACIEGLVRQRALPVSILLTHRPNSRSRVSVSFGVIVRTFHTRLCHVLFVETIKKRVLEGHGVSVVASGMLGHLHFSV